MRRERRKAHEEIKRLKFHLLLENEALKKLRRRHQVDAPPSMLSMLFSANLCYI